MLRQKAKGLRRHIFKLGGEDARLGGELGQSDGVLVIANHMVIGQLTRRALRVWIEHDHGVPQAVRSLNHHPAQLTAAEESDLHG